MLIKVVLSSIPIYQCSILLALKGSIALIENILRNFLWNGGKQSRKKLPLVSWEKISKPLLEGGLQLRDLRTQNLAIGAKLLWNMLDPKPSWCSRVLKSKYFPGIRLRCLEGEHVRKNGSPIFNLC